MKNQLTVFLGLLAVVLGAPTNEPSEPVAIVALNSDIQPDGTFQWNFETADGTKQDQSGSVKAGATEEDSSAAVQGSAAWTDLEGNKHELTYVADENGFQPQGSDVPVVPPQIARALEWIAAHPEPEESAKAA